MRRALAAAFVLALSACSAAAQTPPPAHAPAHRGIPPAALAALVQKSPYYPALREYDRQIAALRALARIRGLDDTGAAARESAAAARAQAAQAAHDVIDLASQTAAEAQREAAFDPPAVAADIERAYRHEYGRIHARAGSAQAAYGAAIDAQVRAQSAALAHDLDQRVRDAYAARVQEFTERENDAEVKRAQAVANRQLELRIRLSALAQSSSQRRAVQAQLTGIARSLNAAADSDRRCHAAVLAAYRQSLEAAATSEYAATIAALQRKAAANWQLRRRVTAAQLAAPSNLNLPLRTSVASSMQTGAAALRSLQRGSRAAAAQTANDFRAGADDIAQRLSTIGAADSADAGSLAAEITAMERARAALYEAIVASLAAK